MGLQDRNFAWSSLLPWKLELKTAKLVILVTQIYIKNQSNMFQE